MSNLPLINLSGNARTRGRTHGEALADSAAANVETYLARFAAGGITLEDALAEGARWQKRIETFDPVYAEEMAGIAEGAHLDPVAIAMLNARWELSYTLFAREAMGCTSFAALPEVTRSGTTLIGQNWDWLDGLLGHMAVLRCSRDDAPNFVCITQAGIAGGIMGLNEAGVGLVVNGMTTDHEGTELERKPFHLRVREILSAGNFTDALKVVVSTPRVCSGNYLLAHADGEAIDIEAAPDDEAVLYPEDGMLTHANHFESLDVTSTLQRNSPSTLFRARRLARLMRQANRPIDIALMQELFTDHFSYPSGICRHSDDSEPEPNRTATVVSVILDLENRVLHASNGPPCENAYAEYPLAS